MPVKIGFLEETPGQGKAFTTMASTACGLKLWQKSIESQNTKQNETSSHGN